MPHTSKGTYQLLIKLDRDATIRVGRLGTFSFPAGYYVYTGSAMGGIEARIRRHLSKTKRFHWHIDFLLERCSIIRYAIRESSSRQECELNAATLSMNGARIPANGFGSSDCKCASHLVYFESEPGRLPAESQKVKKLGKALTCSLSHRERAGEWFPFSLSWGRGLG